MFTECLYYHFIFTVLDKKYCGFALRNILRNTYCFEDIANTETYLINLNINLIILSKQ